MTPGSHYNNKTASGLLYSECLYAKRRAKATADALPADAIDGLSVFLSGCEKNISLTNCNNCFIDMLHLYTRLS